MSPIKIVFYVLVIIGVVAGGVKEEMEADGIVPDTIDEAPSAEIEVIYSGDVSVKVGGELTPTQVKDDPQVKWDANPDKYYVLSMVDPDAPSRTEPIYREIKHWLIVNVKGSDITTGDVIAEYIGSAPPEGSGLHRYIFFAFEQKAKQIFNEPISNKTSTENRINFSIRKFAKTYNLGNPIAGSFFHAQWET